MILVRLLTPVEGQISGALADLKGAGCCRKEGLLEPQEQRLQQGHSLGVQGSKP